MKIKMLCFLTLALMITWSCDSNTSDDDATTVAPVDMYGLETLAAEFDTLYIYQGTKENILLETNIPADSAKLSWIATDTNIVTTDMNNVYNVIGNVMAMNVGETVLTIASTDNPDVKIVFPVIVLERYTMVTPAVTSESYSGFTVEWPSMYQEINGIDNELADYRIEVATDSEGPFSPINWAHDIYVDDTSSTHSYFAGKMMPSTQYWYQLRLLYVNYDDSYHKVYSDVQTVTTAEGCILKIRNDNTYQYNLEIKIQGEAEWKATGLEEISYYSLYGYYELGGPAAVLFDIRASNYSGDEIKNSGTGFSAAADETLILVFNDDGSITTE